MLQGNGHNKAIKRVTDYATKARVSQDKSGVDLNNVKMSMNPFCEIAVEAAIKLKEQKIASETIGVSIGPKGCQDTLRTALGMGIDRVIHIPSDIRTDQSLQPLSIAKILKKIVEKEKIDVAILGKQSIDGDNCQTGPMLAALLSWSQGTFASAIDYKPGEGFYLDRETDNGTEKLLLPIPTVITTDLRLNQPRYVTLPNIMKAKKKNIEEVTLDSLGITESELVGKNKILRVEEPPARKGGVILNNVDELIEKLKTTGVIV